MRKSIFEIVNEHKDFESEARRIVALFEKEKTLSATVFDGYSIKDFVDSFCFNDWKQRGHCVNVDDFLHTVNYDNLKFAATKENDTTALLTLIEVVYNCWNLSEEWVIEGKVRESGNFYHLQKIMDEVLARYNHKAHIDYDNECVLVIEDSSEVTSVAEIVPSQLSFDIIKYNHKLLKGDIKAKKSILVSMGDELEPKRKELTGLNNKLADNIFFMLNNCNIRHNNRSKKDKSHYKEFIAKMKPKTLEKWYDELYQMMLFAFLMLDNQERQQRIGELKQKIIGGSANVDIK